jgi:hypothetical protein
MQDIGQAHQSILICYTRLLRRFPPDVLSESVVQPCRTAAHSILPAAGTLVRLPTVLRKHGGKRVPCSCAVLTAIHKIRSLRTVVVTQAFLRENGDRVPPKTRAGGQT